MPVHLRALVPSPTPFGWAWGPWAGDDPLASEMLSTISELPRVLNTYAQMVAAILRSKDAGDRFNVTAMDASSGLPLGRVTWMWDAHCGLYRSTGDPWVPSMEEARQGQSQRASEVRQVIPRGTTTSRLVA